MDITELITATRIVALKKEKTKDAALKTLVRCLAKTEFVAKEKELAKASRNPTRRFLNGRPGLWTNWTRP